MKNNAKIVLLLSLFTANVSAKQCEFISQLSPYQQDVAYQVYRAGQPYDLGYTALAVAWKESNFGIYKARYGKGNDVSFGIGHTALKWKTKGMDAMHKGMWIQEMMFNDPKSISVMVSDLVDFKRAAKDNWLLAVAKYNGGGNPNYKYARDIANRVKMLEQCNF